MTVSKINQPVPKNNNLKNNAFLSENPLVILWTDFMEPSFGKILCR